VLGAVFSIALLISRRYSSALSAAKKSMKYAISPINIRDKLMAFQFADVTKKIVLLRQ